MCGFLDLPIILLVGLVDTKTGVLSCVLCFVGRFESVGNGLGGAMVWVLSFPERVSALAATEFVGLGYRSSLDRLWYGCHADKPRPLNCID